MKNIAMAASALAAAAALCAPTRPALADGDYQSPTEDRVRISLGAVRVSNSTDLRLDPSGAPNGGTYLNGEDTFGLDRSDLEVKFQAMLRVAERHRLFIDYFSLDRTGNSVVGAVPIQFHDVTLQPGDPVQAKLNLSMLGITYGYSFWHTPTLEIAGTLGIQDTDLSAQVKVQSQTRHVYDSEDQAGPVPAVGFDSTWVISKRFYMDARAQYLAARIAGLDASLGIYELDALYRFRPNVSFALGYTDRKAFVDKIEGTKTGRVDIGSKGPQLFVRVAF